MNRRVFVVSSRCATWQGERRQVVAVYKKFQDAQERAEYGKSRGRGADDEYLIEHVEYLK